MFLPVLLVRDYGVWGFVAFTGPNVVGAAAMGWVLRRPGASARLLAEHGAACSAFTLVTVAFHVYAVFWLGALGALGGAPIPTLVVLLTIPISVAAAKGCGAWACLIWLASAGCALAMGLAGALSWPDSAPTGRHPDATALSAVAAACAFGFALCPYLDRTFHRARSLCAGSMGTWAFVLGFGVFFSAMIVFTLLYARRLVLGPTPVFPRGDAASAWLGAHFILQSLFTVLVHVAVSLPRLTRRSGPILTLRGLVGALAALGALTAAPILMPVLREPLPRYAGLELGEIVYRLFMSFYGLMFPAYVWLCMVPTRDGHSSIAGPIGRRRLIVWAGAVALAAPAFWMGFIERREWWLGPGLAVVLLARLLIPGGRRFV